MPNNTGQFPINSAWNKFKQRKNNNRYISGVLHKEVPFKMSSLTWRTIQDSPSSADRIVRLEITTKSICNCCNDTSQEPIVENIDHLFGLGEHVK